MINGTSVLSNNTLGTGVLTSSLTTVGALASRKYMLTDLELLLLLTPLQEQLLMEQQVLIPVQEPEPKELMLPGTL